MRHRFHSICPYFAMFPESFVQKHLIWSKPGDIVLDPFSGRGTTVLQALLEGRRAIAGDTNPVAVCVSRAKADPPGLRSLLKRIDELEDLFQNGDWIDEALESDEFFVMCFSEPTLRQLGFLRGVLDWKNRRTDRFIAAIALGCLHGESHRSQWCFSNRMPRTISTKPAYSIRWWTERGCAPPIRDVFKILRGVARFRFESEAPKCRGRVAFADARVLNSRFRELKGEVRLMITSPPYIDTTNYREDQWLRLWFLGGPARPDGYGQGDDRHRGPESYWKFLTEAWRGVSDLLSDGAHVVVRIGGRHVEADSVRAELGRSLRVGLGTSVRLVESRASKIRNGQLKAFRPGAEGTQVEYDLHYRVQ